METYYSILEIPETATQEQIKQAHRLLVQVWHPDRFHYGSNLMARVAQKTKEINAAFDTLSNPALKQRYDEGLRSSRARQEQHKPEKSRDDPRTTRCPNPVCDSVLRVASKNTGKVTCPSCRTTFKYDPERNEKWDVVYPNMEKPGRLYEQIAQELETNTVDKGVWTKAYAQAGGDDKQTRVLYIKARFDRLIAIENTRMENARLEAEAIKKKSLLERQKRIQQCESLLAFKGYTLIPKNNGWVVKEPLGGTQPIKTLEELELYANFRQAP